jgi:hypothetical protein
MYFRCLQVIFLSIKNSQTASNGFKTSKSKSSATENTFIIKFHFLASLNQNKMLLIR